MRTASTTQQIKWHLLNNVQPPLNRQTADNIIKTITQFNNAEKSLDDEIFDGAGVTLSEMFEDLKIEVINE